MTPQNAIRAEIRLLRENAKQPDAESIEAMLMSEWPLCMNAADNCYGCPIMKRTGQPSCKGTPLGSLSWYSGIYGRGAITSETFSLKLTEAANWLEDEFLK